MYLVNRKQKFKTSYRNACSIPIMWQSSRCMYRAGHEIPGNTHANEHMKLLGALSQSTSIKHLFTPLAVIISVAHLLVRAAQTNCASGAYLLMEINYGFKWWQNDQSYSCTEIKCFVRMSTDQSTLCPCPSSNCLWYMYIQIRETNDYLIL